MRSEIVDRLFGTIVATAALKRRKATEQELDRLQGTRFQLEMQVNTLESASFNAETMAAMKKAATALKDIHGTLFVHFSNQPTCSNRYSRHRNIDRVDATMADIQEQTQLANEVAEAISSTTYTGVEIDDVRISLIISTHPSVLSRILG